MCVELIDYVISRLKLATMQEYVDREQYDEEITSVINFLEKERSDV